MGIEITDSTFSEEAKAAFIKKLQTNLSALKTTLNSPDFGVSTPSHKAMGAELEMYIIDNDGHPLGINQQLLQEADDPQLTLELNSYNLEYNLTPYSIAEKPFFSTEQEIITQLNKLNKIAAKHEARILPIGILPTLRTSDFGRNCMTDRKRYHALVTQLIKQRGANFHIDINGEHPIQMEMNDVTLEGANTSFQIHYRIDPADYTKTFNAFQLVTPLVIALGANSPGLFGHNLWHETRIPLFKQSIDTRIKHRYRWHTPARVNFGLGWARSPFDLFQQSVNVYPPLLPICGDIDPLAEVTLGKVPKLAELRLHQSSVWLWNRPVYDDAEGGHLRIEMRALPAGPTAIDMVANAAFYIGLAEAFKDDIESLIPALPFNLAEYNFYRAAQFGLDAKIVWPEVNQSGFTQYPITEILEKCLDKARQGLHQINVSPEEIDQYMQIIERRLISRQTGSSWQKRKLSMYRNQMEVDEAHHHMLEEYLINSLANTPVSEWQ